MDQVSAEIFISRYQQLGAVSALLGGLAFAAATSLLATAASDTVKTKLDNPAALTTVFAMACAACQIIATIGWTFLYMYVGTESVDEELRRFLHRWASLSFISGVFLLFISIGFSGWISSRILGIATSLIGAIAGFMSVYIIFQFVS